MTRPSRTDDESGVSLLRDAGGAVAFGLGLLLLAAGLLLVILGLVGSPTVVGEGIAPVLLGLVLVLAGLGTAAAGLVALYRRLTRDR
ncbi:hypothetical protein ELQ92_12790 [Labedella populi]|uniref:Uncharacterized protein n=1 Tax=Labedella populi TaxID=2498850 RepID=A0A444Q6Z9_9MICO|nr:hypothetical protein [Labedella populi]RWZ59686.1 hypothetical protein ELQ92_12790 [Labedella populi]